MSAALQGLPLATGLSSSERLLLLEAAVRGTRYRESMSHRRIAPLARDIERLRELGGSMPEEGVSPARVLDDLDAIGSPATVGVTSGRYFGFVTGGSLPVTVAANWLASAWDQNAVLAAASPTAAELERIALEWVLELLELPRTAGGALVTGATMANFTALAAARHAMLANVGWDVERQGLQGAPLLNVVVGEEAHCSLMRALSLLGIGLERCIRVPVDGEGRMRADALPASLEGPTILCAQAGNVNTGAVDPLQPLAQWARAHRAWMHIDGAFGLWAAAAPHRKQLLAGHALADSWAIDAHKWLNVPYDCGIALVRQPRTLSAALALQADYLPATKVREPVQFTPELSRRARGVEVWAALRALGRRGVAELVERCCMHADQFARHLAAAGARVLNQVSLNQVLICFGSDERTRRIIEAVQRDGTCWCGGTVWQGRAAMRISVSSWATTEADVEVSIAAIRRCMREVPEL
ncbi:MAG TPA: pyridoxal-dependent decarboxylase [Steroidobacteraceae bacterium]|nr:pyridoxal-dependent decarboxylase [Steroidobacteraceae bacterium]